jgi:hypothetical protein
VGTSLDEVLGAEELVELLGEVRNVDGIDTGEVLLLLADEVKIGETAVPLSEGVTFGEPDIVVVSVVE